ncbi:MAG TPA: hypothetical protein VFR23_19160 [Jiangellaceae bacterium]|nr:hypothetical protein [Jiangellaceae bacterium]
MAARRRHGLPGLHAGGVVELDADTLEVVGEPLRLDRYVSNVAVSPGGTLLAVELFNPDALLLVDNARRTVSAPLRGADGPVVSLAFSPDSLRLFTSSTDGTVQLWDVPTQQRLARVTPGAPGHWVFAWFDHDGKYIVAADDRGGI